MGACDTSTAVTHRLSILALASTLVSSLAVGQSGTGPSEEARRAAVIARIGDVTITVGEIEDEINALSPVMRNRHRDPEGLQEYVENRIRIELLAREADRRGYGDDPEVRRTVLESAVQNMIHTEIDERITAASISETDVLAYYTAHDDEFSTPEMRRAYHILLPTREAADALVAEARAADMRSFRALAQEHSEDTESRMRGGDLRFFDRQGRGPNAADPEVHAAIVTAAYALETEGAVSEPVEVDGRFSIVRLATIRPASVTSPADAAPDIRTRLFRERRQDALEEMISRLRDRLHPETYEAALEHIRMEAPERLSADPHAEEAGDEDESFDEIDESPGRSASPLREPAPAGEAPAEAPE